MGAKILISRFKLLFILFIIILGASGCKFRTGDPSMIIGLSDDNRQNFSYSTANSTISVSSNTVPAGSSITITLTLKDEDGNNTAEYSGLDVEFSFNGGSSTGIISDVVDSGDGTYSASFLGLVAGSAVTIYGWVEGEDITSTLPTVTVTAGSAAVLYIEDAAGGTGNIIDTDTLTDSQSFTLYTCSYDANSNFVANESVTWLMSNDYGSFSTAIGSSTIFYPSAVNGDTVIIAVHGSLNNDSTGNITVDWTGLVASLRLNGDFIDDSGENNDGTNDGTSFTAGSKGYGITCGGGSAGDWNHVSLSDNSTLDLSSEGSLSVWIYLNVFNDHAGIIDKGNSTDGSDRAYMLQLEKDGKARLRVVSDSTSIDIKTINNAITTGQWYHLVGIWDASGMYMYLNGALNAFTPDVIVARDTAADVHIGAQFAGADKPFDGTIDEVTIWSRALSLSQIQYLYNSGAGR